MLGTQALHTGTLCLLTNFVFGPMYSLGVLAEPGGTGPHMFA